MLDSRLIKVPEKLSPLQVKNFDKFIRSPYFNSRKDLIDFYQILLPHLLHGKSLAEKLVIHQQLYPQKAYQDERIRQLMTLLFGLLQDFLVHESKTDQLEEAVLLLERYQQWQLPKHVETLDRKTQKAISRKEIAAQPEQLAKGYAAQYEYSVANRREGTQALRHWIKFNEQAFYAQKLKLACLAWAESTLHKVEFELPFLSEVIQEIERKDWQEVPQIGAYYFCYQALRSKPETGYFEVLIQRLETYQLELQTETLRSIYLLALNFCIRRYNAGDKAYLQIEFDLYRASLEAGHLFSEGKLSRFTYRNIVTVCLALRQISYGMKFTKSYRPFVEEPFATSSFHFNMARLCHIQQQYEQALDHLQQTEFEELFVQLAARVTQVKIYFETDEIELFLNQIQNLKKFLYRKKKRIGYHLENYQQFLRHAERLIEFDYWPSIKQESFIHQIEETPNLAERKWLLTQTQA